MNVEFKTTIREIFNCFFSSLSSMTEADFQYKLPILYCVPLNILCYSIIYLATRVQISDRLNDTIQNFFQETWKDLTGVNYKIWIQFLIRSNVSLRGEGGQIWNRRK